MYQPRNRRRGRGTQHVQSLSVPGGLYISRESAAITGRDLIINPMILKDHNCKAFNFGPYTKIVCQIWILIHCALYTFYIPILKLD
jgi:hypothetical protein